MQRHSWREHTEQGARFYRASHHSTNWTLQSKLKDEEEWQLHDPIGEEEWRKLREVLWRKYQRGRCPWQFLERIDKRLEDLTEGDPDAPGERGGDKGDQ